MRKKLINFKDKIIGFDYKNYLKTNVLFLTFVFSSVVNGLLIRTLTVKNFLDIRPIIADMAMVLIIGSFGYLIKPKKRFIYYLVWSIIYSAICVINSMYYTNYLSFSSISLLATSFLIVDVGDAIVENVMEIKDFCYLWQIVVIILVHIKLRKSNYYSMIQSFKNKFVHTICFDSFKLFFVFGFSSGSNSSISSSSFSSSDAPFFFLVLYFFSLS